MSIEQLPTTAKTRVMIGVPAQDSVAAGFAYDLARLVGFTTAERPDLELRLVFLRGTLLPAQRQRLLLDALEGGMTHALFLDSDMRFPKDALLRLLAHKKPMVGVSYPTRRFPIVPTARDLADQAIYIEEGATELIEAQQMGFGCVLIETSFLHQLPLPFFGLAFSEHNLEFIGEDVWFCMHARHFAGISIYVDPKLSADIAHLGEWEFRQEHANQMRDLKGA